jgi:hypothetical protein
MPKDAVVNFRKQVPMQRPGQPAELATTFVMLADLMFPALRSQSLAANPFCKPPDF